MAKAQQQLAELQKELETLKELKAILENQKADITDICARLDRFAAIWGIVAHDAGLINADLNAAVGDEGSTKVSLVLKSLARHFF